MKNGLLTVVQSWNSTIVEGIKQVTLASMDALQNFFFWTWKIGKSDVLGTSTSPMWHYALGLDRGWIPKGKDFLWNTI
jgi:glucan 1,3-beta-glucosidase